MENNDKLIDKITCTSLDKDTIVSYMNKYGACLIPNFISDEKCDIVKEECIERAEVDEDTDFKDGSYRRYDTYQNKDSYAAANKRVYHVDCFSSEMEKFKKDKLIQDVAKAYYGDKDPYSVHVQIYERHEHHKVPVRGFHIDTFETSTFKAFLYLNDVTSKDGPTSIIIGTHNNAELRRMKQEVWGPQQGDEFNSDYKPHPTNFTKEELGEELLENWVKVISKKGTLFLFDTWGVHCGTSPEKEGDRHVVVNYYRKGADLARSDFGYSANADYKKYFGDKK
jgi:hypothetical protein